MNGRMSRMLLVAIAILFGSSAALALGTKGTGMEQKEKNVMTDDGSMMKQEGMMQEEMKSDEGAMMKKDEGMNGTSGEMMEQKDTMKDTMH